MALLDQLWPTLWQSKHNAIIMSLLFEKYQVYNRRINLLIVLASSSSVGAWAIWQKFPFLWSIIIIASQVAMIIKPYFPYSKYTRELNTKCSKMEALVMELEFLFAKEENATAKELKALEKDFITLRRQRNKILEFSDELLFTTSKKMEAKADIELKSYLKTNYDIIL